MDFPEMDTDKPVRERPNILITGTPGTGKSTLAGRVAEVCGYELLDVAQIIKDNQYYEHYDQQYGCYVLDEDRLLDHIEDSLLSVPGGRVVDYHSADLFARRWFDVVLVVRTETQLLYDRLATRGYNQKKLSDNIQCEIFGSILEEAKAAYDPEIVFERPSNTPHDMDQNMTFVQQLLQQWTDGKGALKAVA